MIEGVGHIRIQPPTLRGSGVVATADRIAADWLKLQQQHEEFELIVLADLFELE